MSKEMSLVDGPKPMGYLMTGGKMAPAMRSPAGLMLLNGHSAQGILMLKEIWHEGDYGHVVCTSKTGRLPPIGPSEGLVGLEALFQELPIYHAKADEKDQVAMEDLWHFAPNTQEPPISMQIADIVQTARDQMETWDLKNIKTFLTVLEDANKKIDLEIGDMKRRMGHTRFKDQKSQLEMHKSMLEERNVEVLELVADLMAKINTMSDQPVTRKGGSIEEVKAKVQRMKDMIGASAS